MGEGDDATMEQPRVTVRSKMSNKQEEKKETLSTGNPFKQDKHKDWKKEKDFKEGYLFQEEHKGTVFTKLFSLLYSEKEIDWRSPSSLFSTPGSKKNKRYPSWIKLILPLGGAILLGSVMGFSMLSIFFSDTPPSSTRSIDSHLRPLTPQADQEKDRTETKVKKETDKKEEGNLSLPELKGVLLQGGSYNEKSGAMRTVEAYRVHGWAAVMDEKSPHNVYLGVAQNKEGAQRLSDQYKQEGIGVYLKDFSVGTGSISVVGQKDAKQESLSQFVQAGHQIFAMMSEQTSGKSITEGTFSPDWNQLTQLHRQFVSSAGEVNETIPKESRPYILQMMQAIDQVVQSSDQGRRNWNDGILWQIQEGLIRYALAYEKLVQSI